MHGMKKKRVPRPLTNPIIEAARSAMPITGADLSALRGVELRALDAMAQGRATLVDWEHLANMVNVAEVMAKCGEGVELIEISAAAQVLLARVYLRAKDAIKAGKPDGAWRMTPDEVWAMRETYEYHDLQRQSVPMGRYREHVRRVDNIRKTGSNYATPSQIMEQVNGL